ncbi:MAG TPA: peroxiredoxin, partial [Polyangiales bacterium]
MAIAVNQPAPDFELPSNQLVEGRPGKKIKLSALRGKPVILAFYPLDFSPTCTTENVCFRDDLGQFNELGAQVLGISVDSAWTHKAFAESLKLTFPLLADFHPKGEV